MDIHKIALEIGLFETALNLERAEIKNNDEIAMPLPAPGMSEKIKSAAQMLKSFNKKRYMFLTPEIALIDAISEKNSDAVIIMPCGMDLESEERIENNLPSKMPVKIIKEPYFPETFTPDNGIIIICGYMSAGRAVIMNETYRLAEHYGGFYGKKIFLPYMKLENFICFDGWKQAAQIFDIFYED